MRDSYLMDVNINLSAIIDAHFKKISMQLGYIINPDEDLVNNLGYSLLAEKQLNKAKDLFKMNVLHYPKSANSLDSLGDYYMEIKDNTNAIDNFKKALALREVPQIREKLEKLLKGVN